MQNYSYGQKRIFKIAAVLAVFIIAIFASTVLSHADTTGTVTAQINSSSGAIIRSSTSTKSAQVGSARNNAVVIVDQEIFLKKSSTAKKNRWYHVYYNGVSGYIRADLLKNFSYSGAQFKLAKKTYYRTGAGTKMKKKGSIKKNKVITAVLPVKAKGTSTTWYKFKKGSKCYYIAGTNLRLVQPAASPAPAAQAAPVTTAAAPAVTNDGPLSFSTSGVTAPTTLATRVPFTLKGKVTSTHAITGAEGGVKDASGNWVMRATADLYSNTFDISSFDSKITFGVLPVGSYTYEVNVAADGQWHNQVSQSFNVVQATAPDMIANKALELAWPRGTGSSTYSYSGGSATPAFRAALDQVYPQHNSWGAGPRVGASCDVFVGTVVRASGYDPDFPRGHDEQFAYLQTSPKWARVSYSGKPEELQSGDIITYIRDSGGRHTCIYYKSPDGKNNLIEAQIEKYYGYFKETSDGALPSKVTKFSDKKYLRVYRPTS